MTTETDPWWMLLARAEIAGKPVHPGLILKCLEIHSIVEPVSEGSSSWRNANCDEVSCPGWSPNPDPMALIAACDVKGWGFQWFNIFPKMLILNHAHRAKNKDFQAALLDAAVQATAAEADNLERCHAGGIGSGMTKSDGSYIDVCPNCYGANYVIKETTP